MGVYIDVNKLVIIAEPRNIPFDLPKDVDNNLKNETDSIIKHNIFMQLLSKYKHGKDIHEYGKQ